MLPSFPKNHGCPFNNGVHPCQEQRNMLQLTNYEVFALNSIPAQVIANKERVIVLWAMFISFSLIIRQVVTDNRVERRMELLVGINMESGIPIAESRRTSFNGLDEGCDSNPKNFFWKQVMNCWTNFENETATKFTSVMRDNDFNC